MKKNTVNDVTYSDEPIKLGRRLHDFLPKPEELIFREKKIRVTLTLTQESLDFFKSAAKKHNSSYQAMIRRLLDIYVSHQRQ